VSLLKSADIIDHNLHWKKALRRKLLISLGDITDRGPDSRLILDLFRRLSSEASDSGDRVINLLGNHECLNTCSEFAYTDSEEVKKHYNGSRSFMEAAWKKSGSAGSFLRSHFHVAVKINSTVFVHAGLVGSYSQLSLQELDTYMFDQLNSPACRQQRSLNMLGEDGPVWTRKLTQEPPVVACSLLAKSLHRLGGERMVVGHDVTPSGRIETRCANQLIRVDTGISRFVQNSVSILKISNGHYSELHMNPKSKNIEEVMLFEHNTEPSKLIQDETRDEL